MMAIPSKLVCAAGEHYVAYQLSSRGYIAALTREGAPTADILASNLYATKTLAIQVKTTTWAMRTRGRGEDKHPYELQFPLGFRSAKQRADNLVFAFVDLHDYDGKEPDVYLVPSAFVCEYCAPWIANAEGQLVRFHIDIEAMERFKNNWAMVEEKLGPWDAPEH